MIIKQLGDCPEFLSADKAILRELLHADKGDFKFRYSLAHAKLKPSVVTSAHTLETSEVYYIISGRGLMHVGAESREVSGGCAVYIPPGEVQYIENTGEVDLDFLCIVDPAWRAEDEIVLD